MRLSLPPVPLPADACRDHCAFPRPFHDREGFYIKIRSKAFAIMNSLVLESHRDVTSASADPSSPHPGAICTIAGLLSILTPYFPRVCVHDDDFRPADRISNHRSPIARDCGSAWTKTPSIRGNLAHDDEAAPACSTRRRLFPPRLHPVHAGVQHRGIVRRKWTMRRIRVTIAAHSLRISRILRVNSAWLGGGWCGSGRSGRDRYYW